MVSFPSALQRAGSQGGSDERSALHEINVDTLVSTLTQRGRQ